MADTAPLISQSGFDLTPPSPPEREKLEATTNEEKDVLLHHGTEAPFCGGLLNQKQAGVYCCRLCGLPLFDSPTKFESGTGWPSFYQPIDPKHVRGLEDNSYGMRRIETLCARCGSHQGHVFPDGPEPTFMRFCINSVSLSFVAKGEALPDPLARGEKLRAPDMLDQVAVARAVKRLRDWKTHFDVAEDADAFAEIDEALDELASENPAAMLAAYVSIFAETPEIELMAPLVAGPFEDFIGAHSDALIGEIEDAAREHGAFQNALGGLEQNEMRDEIWERVLAAGPDQRWA